LGLAILLGLRDSLHFHASFSGKSVNNERACADYFEQAYENCVI